MKHNKIYNHGFVDQNKKAGKLAKILQEKQLCSGILVY